MHRHTILVTGANAGIGYVTASRLAAEGMTVVIACRDASKGNDARQKITRETGNADIHLLLCDLASQRAIRQAAADFLHRFDRLDVLINNAAMYSEKRELTEDGIEMQFAVNYLGCYLLTRLLLPMLIRSAPARIVNLSTVNHYSVSLDLGDLQSAHSYEPKAVHMRSKLAVILFTRELARRLHGSGVTANCLHPGVIATSLLGQVRGVPPEARFTEAMGGDPLENGATTPVYLAISPDVAKISGEYFENRRVVESSPETYDEDLAEHLWKISESLAGPIDHSF